MTALVVALAAVAAASSWAFIGYWGFRVYWTKLYPWEFNGFAILAMVAGPASWLINGLCYWDAIRLRRRFPPR